MNIDLIFSAQRALFRAIPKSLKGLKVKIENDCLIWEAYFDEEPTEEEKEVLNVAQTMVIADFPQINRVEEEYIYHPSPLDMKGESLSDWYFVRWEPK